MQGAASTKTHTWRQVFISFLAGSLLTNWMGLFVLGLVVFGQAHHIFIMGAASPLAYVAFASVLALPPVLAIWFARKAFRVDVFTPAYQVVLLLAAIVLGVILPFVMLTMFVIGAFGVDVHANQSAPRFAIGAAIACTAVTIALLYKRWKGYKFQR